MLLEDKKLIDNLFLFQTPHAEEPGLCGQLSHQAAGAEGRAGDGEGEGVRGFGQAPGRHASNSNFFYIISLQCTSKYDKLIRWQCSVRGFGHAPGRHASKSTLYFYNISTMYE